MNHQHVQAFCAIVTTGSFSRAAASLHLTQPTVSTQIQALEKDLGTRLFERSAQGIALTQAGREFHGFALQMLQLADRAREAMEQMQGLGRGRLEVGASPVPGHYVLPRSLMQFKESAPGVEVALSVSNSADVRAGVQSGRFELGIVAEGTRSERLTFEPVLRDELVAVMRREHPLGTRQSLNLNDLREWPLVMRERGSGTRDLLERALLQAGMAPERLRVWMEMGTIEGVKMAVRGADVMAVLSRWTVQEEVRGGALRAARIQGADLTRQYLICWRTHGCLSAASDAFRQFLRNGCDPAGCSVARNGVGVSGRRKDEG